MNKDELKEIAQLGWDDPVFFCRTFLPKMFPDDVPWVHRGLMAILTRKTKFLTKYGELDKIVKNFTYVRDGKVQNIFSYGKNGDLVADLRKYTLIMLPRGFSKTTIAGVAMPLRNVLYMETPVTLYISESARHAEMQLSNVKAVLETNVRVKSIFGDLRPDVNTARWAQDMFETSSGMAMIARGRGGQVRGLNHKGNRPKMIIFDDLEDKESVSTPEQREKVRSWFFGDVLPALPEMDDEATIVGLGTLLHQDALLTYLERDPQWTVVKFGVKDADNNWLWAKNIDAVKYETKKQSAALAGQLSTFHMEYDSKVVNEETQIFKERYINFISPPAKDSLQKAIYLDPAISEKKRADDAVIAVVGMEQGGKLHTLDMWGTKGIEPRALVDQFFEMAMFWRPEKHGIESNGFQRALVYLTREEMFRKKYYFEVIPVTHANAKYERIKGILQPRFAAGYLTLAKRFPKLITQLLEFPNSTHDDWADALAGAVALLDPYAPMAGGGNVEEDEYPPLEEVIGGEWRVV